MRITNAKCSILKENGNALRCAKCAMEGLFNFTFI